MKLIILVQSKLTVRAMAKPGNAESFKVKMEDKGTHESNGNCMDKSDRVVITMLTSLQCDSAFGLPVADLQI